MVTEHIITSLMSEGYEVILKSNYHIQVVGIRGSHNVYVNSQDVVKVMMHGEHACTYLGDWPDCWGQLLKKLRDYNYLRTTQHKIDTAITRMIEQSLDPGVYVDAGFDSGTGNSRIAIIRIALNGDMDVLIRNIMSGQHGIVTSGQAEEFGIRLAITLYPDSIVYTDHRGLVDTFTKLGVTTLKWIPRSRNKAADTLSNLRVKAK